MLTSSESQGPQRRQTRRVMAVEPLEGRALLSHIGASRWGRSPSALVHQVRFREPVLGVPNIGSAVAQDPQFYPLYTGPQIPQLLVTAATAAVQGTNFVFTGQVAGPINTAPQNASEEAVYVFGLNRGGAPNQGPFPGRPGITTDGTVEVSVQKSGTTAQVSLENRDQLVPTTTTLSSSSVKITGNVVQVTVPVSTLTSNGKAINQYRFTFWTRSLEPPVRHVQSVASFVPARTTLLVAYLNNPPWFPSLRT